MSGSYSGSYQAAGVDVEAGYRAVELMKRHVERTRIPGVLSGIGGFGGVFRPEFAGMKEPVLVSGADGVGTKLQLAIRMDKHNTVGIDCVAMCVNDIVCSGAAPLFFLDYIAIGRNEPEKVAAIVEGVAEGCVQAGCALVGGETAEHPGVMPPEEYDLAGFAVGMADREALLDPMNARAGDAVIGVASSGVHSNGFSLIRKIFDFDRALDQYSAELGRPLGGELMEPTRIYVKSVLELLRTVTVRSISHITGGGFFENIPRALPDGLEAVIEKSKLEIPPVFQVIRREGGVPERDMFGTFNMGTGLCVIVPSEQAAAAVECLSGAGEKATVIGQVRAGSDGVVLV